MDIRDRVKSHLDFCYQKIREHSERGDGGCQVSLVATLPTRDLIFPKVVEELRSLGYEVESTKVGLDNDCYGLNIYWLRERPLISGS